MVFCNRVERERVFALHQPDAVMHLAAESHVDRSITGPVDHRDQLLQQLRPLSLPREADPAGDPQRTGWQVTTDL